MSKVKDVSTQIRGVSYKPTDLHDTLDNDSILLLRANNIENDKLNFDDVVYVDKSKVGDLQYLRVGDILICASSGSKNLVGKATIIKKDITATFGAFCKVVRPKDILPNFLGYYFSSPKYRNTISQLSAGANINNIRNEHIDSLDITIPSLEIQKQIAENLDKVTHAIDLCNAILEKLDLLVKARFVEMFGDPVDNSNNLPTKTLLELGELGRGVSKYRPRNAPELLGGKYPLIQTGDVANADLYITKYKSTYSEIGYKQSKMWSKNTLCITIAANIAKTAILTFDSCFPDSVVGFNANSMTNNLYIHYWFTFFQAILEAQAPESAQKNINLKILSELEVTVPPIELQIQFADFVTQTDKTKSKVKQTLEKAETLKKALMQEYFR